MAKIDMIHGRAPPLRDRVCVQCTPHETRLVVKEVDATIDPSGAFVGAWYDNN